MNTLPSWKKLRNPDPKTITSPVGVPRRPGFRALDSTCMKFSKFIKKHLTIYLQTHILRIGICGGLKSEECEISGSKCDPSNCRI